VIPEVTLPELLEAQAARTPEALAVTFAGTQVSYAELNARANRLARHLVSLGAGPERLVAVAMPRSPEMIVAVLAVLKAGAAYVPLDPAYPADRIAFMLADACPVAVLTTVLAGRDLPGGTTKVALDDPATAAAVSDLADGDLADDERLAVLMPAHPAYVIYTSGSTGHPKGVVVQHRNVTRLVTMTSGWIDAGSSRRSMCHRRRAARSLHLPDCAPWPLRRGQAPATGRAHPLSA
jgi:nonribosomal peptide synthetase DhbF